MSGCLGAWKVEGTTAVREEKEQALDVVVDKSGTSTLFAGTAFSFLALVVSAF